MRYAMLRVHYVYAQRLLPLRFIRAAADAIRCRRARVYHMPRAV